MHYNISSTFPQLMRGVAGCRLWWHEDNHINYRTGNYARYITNILNCKLLELKLIFDSYVYLFNQYIFYTLLLMLLVCKKLRFGIIQIGLLMKFVKDVKLKCRLKWCNGKKHAIWSQEGNEFECGNFPSRR